VISSLPYSLINYFHRLSLLKPNRTYKAGSPLSTVGSWIEKLQSCAPSVCRLALARFSQVKVCTFSSGTRRGDAWWCSLWQRYSNESRTVPCQTSPDARCDVLKTRPAPVGSYEYYRKRTCKWCGGTQFKLVAGHKKNGGKVGLKAQRNAGPLSAARVDRNPF
jgi:hypothetical protein